MQTTHVQFTKWCDQGPWRTYKPLCQENGRAKTLVLPSDQPLTSRMLHKTNTCYEKTNERSRQDATDRFTGAIVLHNIPSCNAHATCVECKMPHNHSNGKLMTHNTTLRVGVNSKSDQSMMPPIASERVAAPAERALQYSTKRTAKTQTLHDVATYE